MSVTQGGHEPELLKLPVMRAERQENTPVGWYGEGNLQERSSRDVSHLSPNCLLFLKLWASLEFPSYSRVYPSRWLIKSMKAGYRNWKHIYQILSFKATLCTLARNSPSSPFSYSKLCFFLGKWGRKLQFGSTLQNLQLELNMYNVHKSVFTFFLLVKFHYQKKNFDSCYYVSFLGTNRLESQLCRRVFQWWHRRRKIALLKLCISWCLWNDCLSV